MSTLLLRNAAWVYTCDDQHRVIRNGYVYVRDNVISEIGAEPCPIEGADEVHDLSGCIVLPGMVNVHHHFFQSLVRGVPRTQRAFAIDWLAGLYPLWVELDPDAMYWGSVSASAELLLTGATTSADHSYLMPVEDGDFVAPQVQAVTDTGLRLHLVRGSMPTIEGNIDKQLEPILGARLRRLEDRDDEVIPLIESAIRDHHDDSRYAMVRIALGPTGVSYAKPDFMRKMADIATDSGCGLHTHYLPRPSERERCRRLTGKEPLEVLREARWLRPGAWFAHCPELNDTEIAAFAETGCGVAHCPRTVIRLGYKLTRISAMRNAGVTVGIGVDGASSNDSGAMLNEVRLAHLLHRIGTPDDVDPAQEWMTPYDTLLMATREGARILCREDIGHLAPDMAADITAFDLRSVSYVGAVADPLAALMVCGSDSRAALTVVNGRAVVKNGRLLSFDEDVIIDKANTAARRLLDTAEDKTGLAFRRAPGAGPQPQVVN